MKWKQSSEARTRLSSAVSVTRARQRKGPGAPLSSPGESARPEAPPRKDGPRPVPPPRGLFRPQERQANPALSGGGEMCPPSRGSPPTWSQLCRWLLPPEPHVDVGASSALSVGDPGPRRCERPPQKGLLAKLRATWSGQANQAGSPSRPAGPHRMLRKSCGRPHHSRSVSCPPSPASTLMFPN